MGWRIEGELPNLAKFILIGAPHTSNWDFVVSMALIFGLDIKVYWMGKHTFVDGPLGFIWRRMGGVAIDRRKSLGVVGQIVQEYETREHFVLALAPEGTRRTVDRWKTGFYHMAVGAAVPIMPIGLDYTRKLIMLFPIFHPTGDLEADLPKIQAVYDGYLGKNPDQFSPK